MITVFALRVKYNIIESIFSIREIGNETSSYHAVGYGNFCVTLDKQRRVRCETNDNTNAYEATSSLIILKGRSNHRVRASPIRVWSYYEACAATDPQAHFQTFKF